MNKTHIELLQKAIGFTDEQMNFWMSNKFNWPIPITSNEALFALAALEASHKAEMERLKEYVTHKWDCEHTGVCERCGHPEDCHNAPDGSCPPDSEQWDNPRCTCGLDQLLTPKPKEEKE